VRDYEGADVAKFAGNHFAEELQKHPEFRKNPILALLEGNISKNGLNDENSRRQSLAS